jgi:hypothetical protein
MRFIKSIGLALVIVLAVSAAAASAASAPRLILSEEDGTALPPGQLVVLTASENLTVSSNDFSCTSPEYEEMEVYSTLVGNAGRKATMTFHAGRENEGILIKSSEMEIQCEGEPGWVFVYWNPGGETLTLGANGEARLRPMLVTVEYELLYGGRPEERLCHYAKGALSGRNTATPTREPLTAELNGTLKAHDSPRACPRTIQVSLSLPNIKTYEGGVEEELRHPTA